jgi:hypothetical protein
MQMVRRSGGTISAAVLQDTANNGFTSGADQVTVTVNQPPTSGNYNGNGGYVEVIVAKTISTSFMSVLGTSSMTIRARAVVGASGGACIYALDPNIQDAIVVSGGSTINTSYAIIDESSNSKGFETTGGSCVTASSIQVVGNYNGGCISPAPVTGIESPGDPLAGAFPFPSAGACTYTNWHNNGASLSQGTYGGGITISGMDVTANAGQYILSAAAAT